MLLSIRTIVKIKNDEENIIGHMCYSAYKLWNVCNYERKNYKELNLPVKYPDWYYQKKAHKDNIWFKQLPSQTAQEVCKELDKGWKSFYTLLKTKGIKNPNPPGYKHSKKAITYMQNGIVHEKNSTRVRLTISKTLKNYMKEQYDICNEYLYFENEIFKKSDNIKQIKIYPPENGKCEIIVIYEIEDIKSNADNGKYLSIDIGVHNLMTCYSSVDGKTFIIGRKYLSICHYYAKEIARVQSQWYGIQSKKGKKYPKSSKHISRLYRNRRNEVNDYTHKITRYIVTYCKEHNINTVVIGDIRNIRKDKDFGHVTNQSFHALPYDKIYEKLKYKLELEGIRFEKQTEAYTSQTSPLQEEVNKQNACKKNRVKRGLYVDRDMKWNADCVGAYNILRLYLKKKDINIKLNPMEIKNPQVVKVAV